MMVGNKKISSVVITVLQQKGGGTKTTTSVNLTMALNALGYNAILCDMDKDKPDAVRWSELGDGGLSEYVIPLFKDNPRGVVDELKEQYDFIILDTPPNLDGAALKAALLSDLIIIPCSPSTLDQLALLQAAECAMFAQKPFKLLASKVKKNTISSKQLLADLKEAGDCFETMITNSVCVEGAPGAGEWVGSYKPDSESHKQYLELAREVVGECGALIHKCNQVENIEEVV